MDEQVERAAEDVGDLGEDTLEVAVGADVAGGDERACDGGGELADAAFDALTLVGERNGRAVGSETARDRPGNRAPVGHAQHERTFSGEHGATLAAVELSSCG